MTSIKYNERILYRGIHGELHDSNRLFRPRLIDVAGLLEVSIFGRKRILDLKIISWNFLRITLIFLLYFVVVIVVSIIKFFLKTICKYYIMERRKMFDSLNCYCIVI